MRMEVMTGWTASFCFEYLLLLRLLLLLPLILLLLLLLSRFIAFCPINHLIYTARLRIRIPHRACDALGLAIAVLVRVHRTLGAPLAPVAVEWLEVA